MNPASTDFALAHTKPAAKSAVPVRQTRDEHGLWLFLAASISFALVLACVIYISVTSF